VRFIHLGFNTAWLVLDLRAAGGWLLGVEWRTPIGAAWERIGHDRGIQGNIDPLLLVGPREIAAKRAREILAEVGGRPGHIFNVGHGIVPETPVDNVKAMVDLVHGSTARATA
jgi:uroporphyrinogen decarboxylase